MADGSDPDAGACYYTLLGIRRNATLAEIRRSYRKLSLKWHPDRRRDESPAAIGDAKRRFQQIQEAYSVLSDSGKRAMYDAGIFDLFDEEDQDFTDFMEEMMSMMDSRKSEKPDTLEDLQKMFAEMVGDMEMQQGPHDSLKRTRVEPPTNGGSFFS